MIWLTTVETIEKRREESKVTWDELASRDEKIEKRRVQGLLGWIN
jgi:hypothetical protein